ncbi:MAG TPA: tetratricopeptide repeat protein [Armatimonadota bacterium]|jgi:tetratricopeptide (TPR) repeat protein
MQWLLLAIAALFVANGVYAHWVKATMAPARALRLAGRRREAADAYRRAYETLPAMSRFARTKALLMAANQCIQAGRLEDAAAWAREAMALRPRGLFLIMAHRILGHSLSMQMKLDEAEACFVEALKAARTQRNPQQIGESLTLLALVQYKRGHLAAAMDTAREAEREHLSAARLALQVQYDCFRAQGRWDEARDAQERASNTGASPTDEDRLQAVMRLGHAMLALEQGQADLAAEHLAAAKAQLIDDERLRVWWDSHSAWAAALAGNRHVAEQLICRVEDALPCLSEDRSTQCGSAACLGHATFALGDWRRSLNYWKRHQALQPDVPSQAEGLYHIGRCLQELGDCEGACAAFHEAADIPCPTYYGGLAREARKAMNETEQTNG